MTDPSDWKKLSADEFIAFLDENGLTVFHQRGRVRRRRAAPIIGWMSTGATSMRPSERDGCIVCGCPPSSHVDSWGRPGWLFPARLLRFCEACDYPCIEKVEEDDGTAIEILWPYVVQASASKHPIPLARELSELERATGGKSR